MSGYNYHFYIEDKQSGIEKEELKETTVILFVRRGKFKIKYRTAVKVKPDQWDVDKQEVKRNRIGYASDNNYLLNVKQLAQEIYYTNSKSGIPLTHKILKQGLDDKLGLNSEADRSNFVSFIEQYIKESRLLKGEKTIKSYNTTLNRLNDFAQKYHLGKDFASITQDFYSKFVHFLLTEKKYSLNGAGTHIKNIKLFMNESRHRGLHNNIAYLHSRFKKLEELKDSIWLTLDEIQAINNLSLSYSPRLESVRDIFVVGCYTGLRFSDFSRLEKLHIESGQIHIVPKKTQTSSPLPIIVPFLGNVPAIFNKYEQSIGTILPRVPSNQKMNKYLKEIGELAKINEIVKNPRYKENDPEKEKEYVPKFMLISTHTARRSFATNAYKKKIPIFVIMQVTGHKTEAAFLRYIRLTRDESAKMLKEGWEQTIPENKEIK